MDNLTHSLVGAAIAQVAMPVAPRVSRPLLYTAGVVAANLPDLDLIYSWITPAPLGYLLHHRGHTHTLGGLVVQALLLALVCYAFPHVRRLDVDSRNRLWVVVGAGLISHVLFDAGNSYGVHPFWPISSRWYYGDAVFIFEPWLWVFLAVPVALAAWRRSYRIGLLGALIALPLAMGFVGIVPWPALLILFAAAGIYGWLLRSAPHRNSAAVGLGMALVFVAGMMLVSRFADRAARQLFAMPVNSHMLSVVKTPDPSNPLCWSVIGIERNDVTREYALRPGTLSIAPEVVSPASCKSHRFRGGSAQSGVKQQLITYADVRQSLDTLHSLSKRDCSFNAWLQFARAPVIDGNEVADLRFARGGDNFSAMTLTQGENAATCPKWLTSWKPPRADLLRR